MELSNAPLPPEDGGGEVAASTGGGGPAGGGGGGGGDAAGGTVKKEIVHLPLSIPQSGVNISFQVIAYRLSSVLTCMGPSIDNGKDS